MRASGKRARFKTARTIISCLLFAVAAAPLGGCEARAQGNWWDGLRSGVPDFTGQRSERERAERSQPEPLNDLRPDPTPWCSDVMLNAIAAGIERYQGIVANGGWPVVPKGRMMRVGDEDERVPILRKRLRISGDLSAKSQYYNSETFDSELEEAVRNFQKNNGIRQTGRIDRSVYAVINISAAERLEQLRINYERLRALASCGREDRYVFVNVPSFELEAVERYEVQQRHRVIVGRTERQTPDVRTNIKALNFFPYWNVPESVATLDLIPRVRKEPDYLQSEGIRVLNGYNGPEVDPMTIDWSAPQVASYKFKQDPGEKNALGLVRLDMTNEHGVYMHDTPMKKLFDQRSRSFSAGCVRVQGVMQLAEWIARYEPGWEQPGRASQVLAEGQALTQPLTRPVPVYFAYVTAWVDPSTNIVQFRPDIYGRDRPHTQDNFVVDADDAPPAAAANALAP